MIDFLLRLDSALSCCCSTTSALDLLAGSQLEVSSVSDRELEDDFDSAGLVSLSAETDFLLILEAARDGSLALTTDFLETIDFLLLLDSGLASLSSYNID